MTPSPTSCSMRLKAVSRCSRLRQTSWCSSRANGGWPAARTCLTAARRCSNGCATAGASNTRYWTSRHRSAPSPRRTTETVVWNCLRPIHSAPSSGVLGRPCVNHSGATSRWPLRDRNWLPFQSARAPSRFSLSHPPRGSVSGPAGAVRRHPGPEDRHAAAIRGPGGTDQRPARPVRVFVGTDGWLAGGVHVSAGTDGWLAGGVRVSAGSARGSAGFVPACGRNRREFA